MATLEFALSGILAFRSELKSEKCVFAPRDWRVHVDFVLSRAQVSKTLPSGRSQVHLVIFF